MKLPLFLSGVLIAFPLLFTLPLAAEVPSKTMEQIRAVFYAGVENEEKAEELLEMLNTMFSIRTLEDEPLLLAYYGAGITLIAKHSYNPYTKWNKLKEGLSYLNRAIAKKSEQFEIRFLRYSILHYLPGFLGFSSERDADQKMLLYLLRQGATGEVSNILVKGVITFLVESNRLTEREVTELKKKSAHYQ